jgi:DNA end-binding protein Ku
MAPRPLRTATITFGLVSIPVKFFTAARSEDVSFNLLHEGCGSRVNRKWWCPEHEQFLEQGEMIRAFQISRGRYVTFTEEEIDALESDEERALEITEFVSLDSIDPVFFERAYFLGPGEGGGKTYRLLGEALRKERKVALARWVSGNREHLVVLRPYHSGLILHTMYYADEVRDFGEVYDAAGGEVSEKELRLAQMLIDELTEEQFDPLRYKDEYRQRLLDKIEAKARGEQIVGTGEDERRPAEVIDIMAALQRSIEGTRATKPKQRAAAFSASLPAEKKSKVTKSSASPAPKKKSAGGRGRG